MPKPISGTLYLSRGSGAPGLAFESTSAREQQLTEKWLQDAVARDPEILIGPCRAADLTDEEWFLWATEFHVVADEAVGYIDLLFLSRSGRIAIVETKLAYNAESRRTVVAQVLDYATHLPEMTLRDLPAIPKDKTGKPIVQEQDVEVHLADGDFLLIIAGDELDERAVKLSKSMLGQHMVNRWELALVDVSLFRNVTTDDLLLVPILRGMIATETRQIVRVEVGTSEDAKTHITVERVAPTSSEADVRRRWTEAEVVQTMEQRAMPNPMKALMRTLMSLRDRFGPGVTISPGTGKANASMTLKRNGAGLLELYSTGMVAWRPENFVRAIGEAGTEYASELAKLFPSTVSMKYPTVIVVDVLPHAEELASLITRFIEGATR